MNLNEKDVKKISTLVLIFILIVLSFLIVRPLLIAVLGGLILAYILYPLFLFTNKRIKSKTFSAWAVTIFIILIILVPLWFLTPVIIQQLSEFFAMYQSLDMSTIIRYFFPTGNEKFVTQFTLTLNSFLTTATRAGSEALVNLIVDVPYILINLFVLGFVFFYALRDGDKLKEFAKSVSPLSEHNEKILVGHFKDMTDTVIYDQIIVGVVQGLFAGIGFIVFGIPSALLLTIIAIFFSVIPFLGPFIVWIPVSLYLFASGKTDAGVIYVLYNVIIVSTVDNFVRSYLISKRTKVSPAVVLVGMIGGLYIFNVMGLIIGPLILAYLISLLESFKDRSFYGLFKQ